MNKQNNGQRFDEYRKWERIINPPYDYAHDGLAKRILSKPIAESNNPVLKIILKFYESSIVYMLKITDILKNFKLVHLRNR